MIIFIILVKEVGGMPEIHSQWSMCRKNTSHGVTS